MNWKVIRADSLLLLTAVVWGAAFVAQRKGMDSVGPFTFSAVRFLLGAAALVPLAFWLRPRPGTGSAEGTPSAEPSVKAYLRPCLLAGTVLFTAAALQQIGLLSTTAGKAGFITGLYVVIVPVFGLFLGQATDRGTWMGSVLAVTGLYLLSVREDFSVAFGDGLELAGAFFWAAHVLLVGRFAARLEPVSFSIGQFTVCGLLSLAAAVTRETFSGAGLAGAALPIAYGGLVSVGVGYTLQVVAQKDAPAAHAAILLSLEAVFAAWAGSWLLAERMTWRATGGGLLMLAGCLLAQIWPILRPPPATLASIPGGPPGTPTEGER